jgi:hypothetical protein
VKQGYNKRAVAARRAEKNVKRRWMQLGGILGRELKKAAL